MKAGWTTKSLGELCDILDSRRKPVTKSDRIAGPYPYYGATGIQDFVNDYIFDEPLVLVGEDGAKWESGDNTAFPIEGKCWVNNHAHVLRPIRERLLDNWLIHFLNHSDLTEYVSGLTVPKLNQGSLREIRMPLAPIEEQRRIVTLLDEAFADIATAKANAEKNLQNARELFERHLQATFTIQEGWTLKSFGELAEFRNGINFTKSSKGEAIKIVGVRDFQKNFWTPLDDLETIIPEGEMQASDLIQSGDILFVRSNGNPELIGRSLLVGDLQEPITHSGFTIKARLRVTQLSFIYLCHYLKSGLLRREMIEGGNGANIKSLNQGTLSRLKIAFPDKAKQLMLVEQLEKVQAEIAELESIYRQKLTALDDLKKSLLHQAFSGQF